ncbi:MAG: hypothetical protein QM754_18410 [Tepidisphaeraceae bacterium]
MSEQTYTIKPLPEDFAFGRIRIVVTPGGARQVFVDSECVAVCNGTATANAMRARMQRVIASAIRDYVALSPHRKERASDPRSRRQKQTTMAGS